MTLATNDRRTPPQAGNGSNKDFDFDFPIETEDELIVVLTDSSDVETTQTLNVDYTVSFTPDDEDGGTITMTTAPDSNSTITMGAESALTQETDLKNQDGYNEESIEDQFDRHTRLIQELKEAIGRSVKSSLATGNTSLTIDNIEAYCQSQVNLKYASEGYAPVPITTMSALLALDKSDLKTNMIAILTGFYTPGDGGGGVFRWNSSGDASTHNGGTIIDHDIGVSPGGAGWWTASTGTGIWERIYDTAVNTKWFGAKCDGVTNDTSPNQAALDTLEDVIFDGDTVMSLMKIYRDTALQGINNASITVTGDSETSFIQLGADTTFNDFSMKNIKILNNANNTGCILVDFSGSQVGDARGITNVVLENCWFNNTASTDNIIEIWNFYKDVAIRDCKFIGVKDNVWADTSDPNSQSCIIIYANGAEQVEIPKDTRMEIDNCKFENGGYAYRNYGSTLGSRNVSINNCTFYGQNISGIMGYHAANTVISGNIFYDISAPSRSNNDGAVCWIDTATNDDTYRNGIVFSGNTIKNCIGNGLYCEDPFTARVYGNLIIGMKKRTGDTYQVTIGTATHSSDGGNGILIGSQAVGFAVDNNVVRECESAGILISGALGVYGAVGSYGRMSNVRITNNTIYQNEEDGILVDTRYETGLISGNTIVRNCGSDTTYAGIRFLITENAAISPNRVVIDSNNFYDSADDTPDTLQLNCIIFDDTYETYNAMTCTIVNNMFYLDGTDGNIYIYALGINGSITGNTFIGLATSTANVLLGSTGNEGCHLGKNFGLNSSSPLRLSSVDDGDAITWDVELYDDAWNVEWNVEGTTPYLVSFSSLTSTGATIHIKSHDNTPGSSVEINGTAFVRLFNGG